MSFGDKAEGTRLPPPAPGRSPAFTQAVSLLTGNARTFHIRAQGAVDAKGKIVGARDIAAQTTQILSNIEARLGAAGALPEHLMGCSLNIKVGEDLQAAVAAGRQWWGPRPNPPINSVMFVPKLLRPEFLITIEGVAIVPR
jgi:enamine deaminase RidA (YjgF/YER057c/UK114 family)